jgi:glycosyltransferase involved in cell wall biosynthesis
MESMACGTPCVGFDTGGIQEMIDHNVNGYVANYSDAEDLSRGIQWVLEEADYGQLSQNARKKVEECYSEVVVAKQYKELYQQMLIEVKR